MMPVVGKFGRRLLLLAEEAGVNLTAGSSYKPITGKSDSQLSPSRVTPNLSMKRKIVTANNHFSPEVQVLGQNSLSQSVCEMTRKSDELYNKKFCSNNSATRTPFVPVGAGLFASDSNSAKTSPIMPYVSRDSSTGGKLPYYGPRRVVKPGPLFQGEYQTDRNKISVSNSQLRNYKAICHLASSQYSNEDAVSVGKVRCTYWSLGESLKPGGSVNPFVVSAFCYSWFPKPSGHPDVSKSHYIFANIGENQLKELDEANQDILARAFKRSFRNRPLNHSNNVSSFEFHWDKCVQIDMNFDEYQLLYPIVPEQPAYDRVKIANELLFLPGNSGMKNRAKNEEFLYYYY
ncbi:hypothetical protein C2845_PM11G01860 [Panicum miliaceum]|uniref:Uncharacterized protein n=1 Tax=Panicum miliaceum TaxID=4540 RepID=A0A3L6RW79_PANMI|nr:hypothetical protein C2845_PM11G01860 [Panicum miliaceum]